MTRDPDRSAAVTGISTWSGRRGYEELQTARRVRTADPAGLRAELRELTVDGTLLQEWRSTPLTISSAARRPGEPRALRIIVVAGGRIRYAAGSGIVVAAKGSVHAHVDDAPTTMELLEPTRLVSALLPLSSMPGAVSRQWSQRTEQLREPFRASVSSRCSTRSSPRRARRGSRPCTPSGAAGARHGGAARVAGGRRGARPARPHRRSHRGPPRGPRAEPPVDRGGVRRERALGARRL